MRLTFWGTRGSLAMPGPDTVRYGGNTSCVQLESDDGTLVVLDCGTGARGLGERLMAGAQGPVRGHILFSHTHWDHIQGMPFFAPLFVEGNEWDVYGPHGFGESLRDTLAGQMQYDYFPVTLDALGAEIRYHCLIEGLFQVGGVRVRTRYLNHPALTLGYRLEADGVAVVYACDHEPHSRKLATEPEGLELKGQDLEHAEFLRDADLVIHDAQYTAEEYPNRIGWGHSTVEYVLGVCRHAGVKRLALTHHDPSRDDEAVDRMMESLLAGPVAGSGIEVFAAAEGQEVELREAEPQRVEEITQQESAIAAGSIPGDTKVLLGMDTTPEGRVITASLEPDDIEVIRCSGKDAIMERYRQYYPSLVILDEDSDGLEICRSIRALDDEHSRNVPIVLVGPGEESDPAVTEVLQPPFSMEYARTRVRAWLLRAECRWIKAPLPEEEQRRLAALKALNLLDSEPEERFDRITRLASALFEVPVALVTLIDGERQWFKSCVGTEQRESHREVAFCAHAILSSEPFVVPDTLQDNRFADNPVVAGPPHVRFYAGYPITTSDGFRIGTLCILDFRPKDLGPRELQLLKDLAEMVEREIQIPAAA